ncbi:MAG: serine hydrolase, partial [candidate division Zixibacteria bacterium]|nr:serine hydrolase [candidate division Zixibacteria bacterium]
LFCFVICLVAICCSNPTKKTDSTDNLPILDNIDYTILDSLTAKITNNDFGPLTSFLIQIDGQIIYEQYFRDHSQNDLHELQSVTKSFSSALIGIAVDDGYIDSIEIPIFDFFPEYSSYSNMSDKKERMTLEHVLQMRTGIQWDEWSMPYGTSQSPIRNMMRSADFIKYVLDLPVQYEPGTYYTYNTGASMLLGGVIQNQTGKSPKQFADEYLFEPLGITNYEWPKYANGPHTTGFGLVMQPRDMLKFGSLFLNDGIINGDTLLSAEWIAKSIGLYSNMSGGGKYGYQWWIMPTNDLIDQEYVPYAAGWGIQHIVYIKSLDMVVVCTGEDWDQEYWPIKAILYDYVFKVIKD